MPAYKFLIKWLTWTSTVGITGQSPAKLQKKLFCFMHVSASAPLYKRTWVRVMKFCQVNSAGIFIWPNQRRLIVTVTAKTLGLLLDQGWIWLDFKHDYIEEFRGGVLAVWRVFCRSQSASQLTSRFLQRLLLQLKFLSDMMRCCSVVAESKYVILQRTNKESANLSPSCCVSATCGSIWMSRQKIQLIVTVSCWLAA